MVRFIITTEAVKYNSLILFTFQYGQIYYKQLTIQSRDLNSIYIPIWLDLLYAQAVNIQTLQTNLHSNMVRFIIRQKGTSPSVPLSFTFQYGQIYYECLSISSISSHAFTFQYGQIYYVHYLYASAHKSIIYIPIWLDLLLAVEALNTINALAFTFQYGQIYYYQKQLNNTQMQRDLHSNMVRFII